MEQKSRGGRQALVGVRLGLLSLPWGLVCTRTWALGQADMAEGPPMPGSRASEMMVGWEMARKKPVGTL